MTNLPQVEKLLKLSVPLIASQYVVLCSGLLDTVYCGHLGPTELSAISLASGIWIAIFATCLGFLHGLTPLIAHAHGAKNDGLIRVLLGAGVLSALALSIPGVFLLRNAHPLLEMTGAQQATITLATSYLNVLSFGLPAALLSRVYIAYLPAVGISAPILQINIASLVFVKAPFGTVLTFGLAGFPRLGVIGCAISSSAMFWGGLVASIISFVSLNASHGPSFRHSPKSPTLQAIISISRTGSAIAISQLSEIGSFTVLALLVAGLGAGQSAAHQILSSLTSLLYAVPYAIASATQALTSAELGAKCRAGAWRVASLGLMLSVGLAAIFSIAISISKNFIVNAYSNSYVVKAQVLALVTTAVIFHVLDATQVVCSSILRSLGSNFLPTAIHVGSLWIIGVVGGYFLQSSAFGLINSSPFRGMGVYWLTYSIGLGLSSVIMLALLVKAWNMRAVRLGNS